MRCLRALSPPERGYPRSAPSCSHYFPQDKGLFRRETRRIYMPRRAESQLLQIFPPQQYSKIFTDREND